jgi:hypothetical protein
MNNPADSNGLILTRFKVQVLTAALHSFTVVATSPQDAVQKVMSGQGGAEAGREGPSPIAMQVQPMALLDEKPITLQQALEKFVMDTVNQNRNRTAQGMPPVAPKLIEVVSE